MKGAKRILSVFLLVMMLCTFFVFPSSAASNLWPSNFETWTRENLFVVGSSGIGLDLRGDPPKLGSAQKEITLVGGRTYRIVGTLSFRSSYADSHIGIGLMSGNDDPVTLCYFDGNSRDISVDVEFTAPSNNQAILVIVLYGKCTVTFVDFSLSENVSKKDFKFDQRRFSKTMGMAARNLGFHQRNPRENRSVHHIPG